MRYTATLLALMTLTSATLADTHRGAPELQIGSEAPSLGSLTWLKGDRIDKFALRHVYVIEFWATWCGPCKAAMPHLSALARKYSGQVTVIGVNVRELQSARARAAPEVYVRNFVESQGDRMDYVVAMDDPVRQPVFNAWMRAAGLNAIPTAFVVDGDGRIAWFETGVTLAGLEKAIEGALAGNVDYGRQVEVQIEQTEERLRKREHLTQLLKPLHEFVAKGDHASVLRESERLMNSEAVPEGRVKWQRLIALLHTDEVRGLDYARRVIGDEIPDPDFPSGMPVELTKATLVQLIARENNLGERAYRLALGCSEDLVGRDTVSPVSLGHLAEIRFRIGDIAGAVVAQEKAVALAWEQHGSDERWRKWISGAETRLEELRARLK